MTETELRGLYPPIEPFDEGWLRVSDLHEIHFEQCGNPDAPAALFVHGGPGGGFESDDRRFFDPDAWRIVLFDQRGAGRSRPHACLEENETRFLVADMEALRAHLGIDRWTLFGGSWGSTLSLAYAQAHPGRVAALILRGIFLLRRWELDWYYRSGTPGVFPEAAARLHGLIPPDQRDDPVGAYHRMVTGDDADLRRQALENWAVWEGATSSLHVSAERIARFGRAEFAEAFAGIELHYFVNRGFFPRDGELLLEAHRLAQIPGAIVHGRYDMVCPVRNALELHAAWPAADLQIVPDAGHASREPGTIDRLVRATDRFSGHR